MGKRFYSGTMSERDTHASRLIFGEPWMIKMATMERKLSLPEGSVSRYIERPYKIPLEKFAAICQARGLTDTQVMQIIKTYYIRGR